MNAARRGAKPLEAAVGSPCFVLGGLARLRVAGWHWLILIILLFCQRVDGSGYVPATGTCLSTQLCISLREHHELG